MLSFVRDLVSEIESEVTELTTRSDVLARLRLLGLSDFGSVMFSMPSADFPKISSLLPTMASIDVQRLWTGYHGHDLLVQSVDFMRAMSFNASQLCPNLFSKDQQFLDFGCGYGRLMRLMYYFANEDAVHGIDPWSESVRACDEAGLRNVGLSDYLPASLPYTGEKFNLIFAFSVFTHLSERATRTCLSTLSKYLLEDGVLAITIRPPEYWNDDHEINKASDSPKHIALHASTGFAFAPHPGIGPIDGDITYGDTSISIEWLNQHSSGLRVRRVDRSLNDPFQRYVYLTK